MKPKLITLRGEKGYAKLSFFRFNRAFSLRQGLVDSMRTFGFMEPIIVCHNTSLSGVKELYVLDGQHRAMAAQYLNIDFYAFYIGEIESKEEIVKRIAKYNNSSSPWKVVTYCEAWAEMGLKDFSTLIRIAKTNGYTVTPVASLLSGHLGCKNGSSSLKDGTFSIKALDQTITTLGMAKGLVHKLNNRMLLAFHKVRLTCDKFDYDKFRMIYNERHEEIRASKLDDYYDLFLSYFI